MTIKQLQVECVKDGFNPDSIRRNADRLFGAWSLDRKVSYLEATALGTDPDDPCDPNHFDNSFVAVYNENCAMRGQRCYAEDRQNSSCGYPHGDVRFVLESEFYSMSGEVSK